MLFKLMLSLLLLAVPLATLRLGSILPAYRWKPARRTRGQSTHVLVVLGSGGHTAEMIAMLERAISEQDQAQKLDWRDYSHRTWIVGKGDSLSAQRVQEFEGKIAINMRTSNANRYGAAQTECDRCDSYEIRTVPRARNIHQPLYTTPFSSLRCLWSCIMILLPHVVDKERLDFPDLVICNGPATAAILVLASIILRFFNYKSCNTTCKMRTIYVESWARVKRPSLSGRLLVEAVDRFIVQWPQLEGFGGRAEYLGVLV